MDKKYRSQLERKRRIDEIIKRFQIPGIVRHATAGDRKQKPGVCYAWESKTSVTIVTDEFTYVVQKLEWWFNDKSKYSELTGLNSDEIHTYMPGMKNLNGNMLDLFYDIWNSWDVLSIEFIKNLCEHSEIMPEFWKVDEDWVAFRYPQEFNLSRPPEVTSEEDFKRIPLNSPDARSIGLTKLKKKLNVNHDENKCTLLCDLDNILSQFEIPQKLSKKYPLADIIRLCVRDTLADFPESHDHEWNNWLDSVQIDDGGITIDNLYVSLTDFETGVTKANTVMFNNDGKYMFADFRRLKLLPLTIEQMVYLYTITDSRPEHVTIDPARFEQHT